MTLVQLHTGDRPARTTPFSSTAALPPQKKSKARFAALLTLGIVLSACAGAVAALVKPVPWFSSQSVVSAAPTTLVVPASSEATTSTAPHGYFIEGKGWQAELPATPDGFRWKYRINRGQFQGVDAGVQVWHLVTDTTTTTTTPIPATVPQTGSTGSPAAPSTAPPVSP